MMAEDATPLIEALLEVIDAARAYLPRTRSARMSSSPECLQATDNPRIIAALAAHGHPVSAVE